ncbi:hypothetical protein [Arthrobacter sp. zg-Y1110]|uniref:hypothetical protein n=1 Tax=Arthrobacter sp. zg-Y1110 TaxID=2886932 RepID=UPI001D15B215|nr:hypothetical protein [Arthrobacter sp. zg-Y1110]MCC3290359.1 hypothetical protein [Arthrobacter sp. zg-Y1110]UWX84267.1 hypothetical protein N2K99_12345 [Arthrobacter sp. zg-Y1110]
MRTVREVLGPECRKPFISLVWEGRKESALEVARRLAPTMSLISDRYPAGSVNWYLPTDENGGGTVPVPEDPGSLESVVKETKATTGSEFDSSGTYLFLYEDPAQRMNPLASISVAAGFTRDNEVTVDLPEDFPLGPPSAAARLFLDLVRIWQPDSASFMTVSAIRASMGKGCVSHAAYLAWTSAKAHEQVPAVSGEYVIPFGEGQLFVAREWTLPGIVALHDELGPEELGGPKVQDPPSFPDGYPTELDGLDSEILWGSESQG